MANVKGGLLANKQENKQVANAQQSTLGVMIGQKSVQERFEKMLGKKSAGFLSSLLTITNNNKLLANADPRTVLAAAATAASLDLPINQSLGKAWIVPYKGAAQFQLGYKGVIELAQRSGRLKFITMTPVYEGEIRDWNRFTETYQAGEKESDEVVGYFASFELLNGFKKSTYWTKDEVIRHAKRFSKSFGSGPWQSDFDAMACKTVLLSIMKTYAPMSIEMQEAMEADGKVATMNASGETEYMDVEAETVQTEDGHTVDVETGEIIFSADDVEEAVQG
jgi:recombination protein RecT